MCDGMLQCRSGMGYAFGRKWARRDALESRGVGGGEDLRRIRKDEKSD